MARLEEMSWLPPPARPKAKGKRTKRLAKAVFVSKSTPKGADGDQGDGQEDEREREVTEEDNQDQVHRSQGDDDGEKEIPEALLDVLGPAPDAGRHAPGRSRIWLSLICIVDLSTNKLSVVSLLDLARFSTACPTDYCEEGGLRFRTVVGAVGILAGLVVFNRRLKKVGEPARIGGEERHYSWRGGKLAYRVAGKPDAQPLLLVHGIYAGASSYEYRKNFYELAEDFRVYALDLLGCGLSDRPRRRYEPEDVAAQVEDFAREEIRAPAYLISSSLSAALLVPIAVRSPRLFNKLVLICPTGLGSLDRPSGLLGEAIYGLFRTPILGDSLYHTLVSRRGIRYYLANMAYHDPNRFVTDEVVEDYYRTSHQPGAKHFPAAFVSGKLNLGLADRWPRVPHKTLIVWGQEARTTPVLHAQRFVQTNPRTEPKIFRDAALLPHDERSTTFNEEVKKFLLGGTRRQAGP